MSNLIVMPGSSEFKETVKGINLNKPVRSAFGGRIIIPGRPVPQVPNLKEVEAPVDPNDLRGRTLMLNTAVCTKFQCGGFQLSLSRQFAIVDDKAQQEPIRRALADGKLVDITGQDTKKGFKNKHGQVTGVEEAETGQKAFVARDKEGRLVVAIPKNKTQAKQFEREIKRDGILRNLDYAKTDSVSGFGGVTSEDVPLDANGALILDASKPTRGKISVRSTRRQRKPRRK